MMKAKLTLIPKAGRKQNVKNENPNAKLFSMVLQNTTKIGNKTFAYIPVDVLAIDPAYQRTGDFSQKKIHWLVKNWDDKLMEPLRVSAHKEELKFYVVDGAHRLSAATINGLEYLVCEIVPIGEMEPEVRRLEEAKIFVDQGKGRNPLAPLQKHKGNLLLGDPDCTALQRVLDKYGISLRPVSKGKGGRVNQGQFGGYSTALRLIHSKGEQHMDTIVNILCGARWNMARDGFSSKILSTVSNVLTLHPDYQKRIETEAITYLMQMEPIEFLAAAHTAYPRRTETERATMYLEDKMADAIGFEKVYKTHEREIDAALDRISA